MLVMPWHPVVLNVATILVSIPANAVSFTVVDFSFLFNPFAPQLMISFFHLHLKGDN